MKKSNKKNYVYNFYSNEADCIDGEWIQVHNIVHAINEKSESDCDGRNKVWGYYLDQKSIEMGWKLKKKCLQLADPMLCSRPFETASGFLSNYDDGEYPRFDYTLPDVSKSTQCILRIRYNVTQINDTNEDVTFKVYQDRSHVFQISPRPAEIPKSQRIVNLNVRGKRGNIVQTYPSVEYDFIPNRLKLRVNDAVHLQWAGSNSHKNNPTPGRQEDGQTGDDGQGKSGSDRSNFVQIPDLGKNFPLPYEHTSIWNGIDCLWSSPSNGKCKESNRDMAIYYAYSGFYHCYEDCGAKSYTQSKEKVDPLLNTAPASVNGHVFSFNKPGNYTYMSSR